MKLGKARFSIRAISIASTIVMYFRSVSTIAHTSVNNQSGICGIVASNAFEYGMLFLSVVAGSLLPFMTLLFSNLSFSIALIARRLRKTPNPSGAYVNRDPTANFSKLQQDQLKAAKIEKNYVKILFVLTSSFLLFNTCPLFLLLVDTDKSQALSRFVESVYLLFVVVNFATNFLFYLMSGPTFREAFKKALFKAQNRRCNEVNLKANSNPKTETATPQTSTYQETFIE